MSLKPICERGRLYWADRDCLWVIPKTDNCYISGSLRYVSKTDLQTGDDSPWRLLGNYPNNSVVKSYYLAHWADNIISGIDEAIRASNDPRTVNDSPWLVGGPCPPTIQLSRAIIWPIGQIILLVALMRPFVPPMIRER